MDDTQRARQHRNENVAEWVDAHQAELNATAAVTEPLKDALLLINARALHNDMIATQDNTGVAETKNMEREELVIDARECLNFLVKHFTTTNNRDMLRQVDYTRAQLENADNTIMEESAMRINEIATPLMAALILIGYTALKKTAFDNNLADWVAVKGKPKAAKVDSSSKGVSVDEDHEAANENQALMDVEMNLLQFSHAELYRAYYLVRAIDDSPSSSGNTVTDTVDIGGTKKVDAIIYDPAATITIKITSIEPAAFSFKDGGADVGLPIKVMGGTTVTKTHAEFAPSGNELWATNGSLLGPSTYKVTFN